MYVCFPLLRHFILCYSIYPTNPCPPFSKSTCWNFYTARAEFVGQGGLCRTIPLSVYPITTVLALAPNDPENYLQGCNTHIQDINPPTCKICSITTHQPIHCDHLPPTCYRNQQQLPRYLTGHSPSLLLKPGISYQRLFDLQHHFIFSLAISKRTSSQLPLNSHQPSPEPLTHHYYDELWHHPHMIIDWLGNVHLSAFISVSVAMLHSRHLIILLFRSIFNLLEQQITAVNVIPKNSSHT